MDDGGARGQAGPPPLIRAATASDLPRLRDIEIAAGQAFRSMGMSAVADDEPPCPDDLLRHVVSGHAWVAADGSGAPVGYLLMDIVDGNGHIEQVSVHPHWSRRGVGRALLRQCAAWSGERNLPALTLTTFRDVPWNAPYYRRLGFAELPGGRWGPQLAQVVAEESAHGLDRWPRVAMRLPLPCADPGSGQPGRC